MLKGVDITYIKKTKTGADGFGADVFSTVEETVKNVLVAPANNDANLSDVTDLSRRGETLLLGIPKGDTHDWETCTIKYNNKLYKSVGIPEEGIEAMVPTQWHKKVKVERYG